MKKVIQGASLLMMLCISINVYNEEITENSFDKLMALSGLNKQISEFSGMIPAVLEQVRQQGPAIPNAIFKDMQKSFEDAFLPSEILSTIGIEIKKSISESEVKDLLVWYESDLGRRITEAEERASTPAAYQEMIKDAQFYLADEKHLTVAKKMDSLLNATDMTMLFHDSAQKAVFTAISTVMNPDQPVDIEALEARMSSQDQQLRVNIKQLTILTFIYTYKEIDMVSTERYVKFIERPSTRKFNDSIIRGMKYAFTQLINKMAKSFAVKLKKRIEKGNK